MGSFFATIHVDHPFEIPANGANRYKERTSIILAFESKEDGSIVLTEGYRLRKDSGPVTPHKVLRTAREIHGLSIQRACSRAYPTDIEGVVTYFDPSVRDTFVQDDTGGIFIFSPPNGQV